MGSKGLFSGKNGGVCLSFRYLGVLSKMHIRNELLPILGIKKARICRTGGGGAFLGGTDRAHP